MEISLTDKIPNSVKIIKATSNPNDETYDILITNFLDILSALKTLQNIREKAVVLDIASVAPKWKVGLLNRAVQGLYTFDKYKTKTSDKKRLLIYDPSRNTTHNIVDKLSIANEVRDLTNEPGNMSTPNSFCEEAKRICKDFPDIVITAYDEKEIQRMGLGLIYGVGKGSVNPPRFLVMDYHPKGANGCICLIGKGVTMDTGGVSIKPRETMYTMHMDDTGAAIVVGMMKHFASTRAKTRIVGVCPLVENFISGGAQKPGDVFTAFNKKTVEVVDTDAEGRLILADAISYSCEIFKPDYIIDFATLTSWSAKLHCHTSYTYFTLDEQTSKVMNDIGEKVAERNIRIPPWTEYVDLVKSDVADFKNFGFSGCANSDGFMAVMFLLSFFPPPYVKRWVHFDIKHLSHHPRLGLAEGFLSGVELVERLVRKKLMLKLNANKATSNKRSP